MKKILTLLLVMAMVMTGFTACGSGNEGEAGGNAAGSVEGTPAEIIEKIYEQYPVADLPLGTIEIDLADADAVKMFTGLDSAEKITEAAAFEPMMGSMAFSMVLVRVTEGADSKAVAESMKSGIDTRKWICVEANDLKVAGFGDVVMLIMVNSDSGMTAQSFVDAFAKIAGFDPAFVI